MTTYTYSLNNDFIVGVDQEQLIDEIKEVISTGFHVKVYGDKVVVVFDSSLSGADQTLLNNVVANHNATNYQEPIEIEQLIPSGEIFVLTHFPDPEYQRRSSINEDTTDTFDNTSFTFSGGYTGKYSIDAPLIAELNQNSLTLIGSNYVEGTNISGDGTASASTSTSPSRNANDGRSSTFWYNTIAEPAVGSWWMVDFGSVRAVYSLEVEWYSTTYYGTDVSIQWSNDATNWNLILRDQSVSYTSSGNSAGNYKFADFPQPVFARYFRIYCNGSNNSTYFILREARFFEAVGSNFSTSSTATLTSNDSGQINTFSWDTINSCQLQGTFPSGTTTKMLLSFDGRSTWVYWSGSAWVTESNIANSTMTPTVFNSLTSANFAESGGLNDGGETIDIKINIGTSDSTKSPIINSVLFNVTTKVFREQSSEMSIRVRNVSSRKTEFKNISDTDKTFHISIRK